VTPHLAARKWGVKLPQQGAKIEISVIQGQFAHQPGAPGTLSPPWADSHWSTEFGLERCEAIPQRAFVAAVFSRLSLLPGSWQVKALGKCDI